MLLASSCVLVVVVVVVHPAINVNNAVAPIIMKKIRFTWFFLSPPSSFCHYGPERGEEPSGEESSV